MNLVVTFSIVRFEVGSVVKLLFSFNEIFVQASSRKNAKPTKGEQPIKYIRHYNYKYTQIELYKAKVV